MKKEVAGTLASAPLIIREYTSHIGKATGKFIRARALLSCAQDDLGEISPRAVRLAAAIEIFHLATLVHDDVIDDAPIRRGIATLQKKFGTRTAVICGDYLLSIALRMLASAYDNDSQPEQRMVNLLGKLCLGELRQHINNGNYSLSVLQYLKIIAGKTASLFEAAFFLGASLAIRENAVLKAYGRFGRYIGMVFQLTDDCLDFESTEQTARKPVQSDYEQNVVTLPLIHALRESGELREKALAGHLERETINETVVRTGGLRHTKALAGKYYKKAMAVLEGLDMPEFKRMQLSAIAARAYGISAPHAAKE
ncbi:MAG: polyprenyl synthetase family protein [Clostridia bacterium]